MLTTTKISKHFRFTLGSRRNLTIPTIFHTFGTMADEHSMTSTPYTSKENNAVNRLLEIAEAFKASKSKKMTTASPLAQGKKQITKGNKHTITTIYYTTNVPCGLHELYAHIVAEDNSANFIEKIEEVYNDHHSINYYALSFPKPVHDREFHTSVVTKIEAEKIMFVSVPCFIEEKARNVHPDRVRAEVRNSTF